MTGTHVETPEESLRRQMVIAWKAGQEYFIDEDTKTLISLDPMTGQPGAYGCWVRSLRLQRRQIERRWTRRARRFIARVFNLQRASGDKND